MLSISGVGSTRSFRESTEISQHFIKHLFLRLTSRNLNQRNLRIKQYSLAYIQIDHVGVRLVFYINFKLEHTLRMFENMLIKSIYRSNRREHRTRLKENAIPRLNILYPSIHIIKLIKSRNVFGWVM